MYEARGWAQRYATSARPLSLGFFGPVGTGKSYSACATVRYLVTRRTSSAFSFIKFEVMSLLMQRIKSANFEARQDLIDELSRTAVLILDDVARGKLSDYDVEMILGIIDARQLDELPTIITSNSHPEDTAEMIGVQLGLAY